MPSGDIEYTIIRAREAVYRMSTWARAWIEYHYSRIRQVGFGSLLNSNPAWLSALGPVVSDPASASGISAIRT